jgi:hypothetical protein
MDGHTFNPPPGWPAPPSGWSPPDGWKPDPNWPPMPDGWQLWLPDPGKVEPQPTTHPSPPPAVPPLAPAAPFPTATPASPPAVHAPPQIPSDASASGLREEIARLRAEVAQLRAAGGASADDLIDLDDERVLQEVGIYNYHHPLENAEAFKERLVSLQERLKEMVLQKDAILASEMFTYNNSLAKGRKMSGDFSKLMLRAYNSEADSCIRSLRAGNVVTAKKRLDKAVSTIAKLGSMMEMRVNPDYHTLRFEEIELTSDYLMKVQEEKERAREEREELREQRKAEQELAAERERLSKERSHYENALAALRANGDDAAVAEMEAKIGAVDEAIEQNDFRAANIRAGYVYVISNPGSFGRHIVKIGLTRRLEPMDRVKELGDASVPFPFEVHAIFFADDAVTLENELHHAFAEERVNRINERREFFFATPEQVRRVLAEKVGNLLEFNEHPEATQFLQSKKYWPAGMATTGPTINSGHG